MRCILATAALFLTACSPPDECAGIPQPPEEFDHMPNVALRLAERPSEQIDVTCRTLGMTIESAACSKGSVVIVPSVDGREVTLTRQACYLHHELGHVNGAPANHKGWR